MPTKNEPLKDVVIGKRRFQIGKMTAETGSQILFKLMAELRKVMSEDGGNQSIETKQVELTEDQKKEMAEAAADTSIQLMLQNLDEDGFKRIQRRALEVCGEYTAIGSEETVFPVLMNDGRIAIPTLVHDIQVISTLTRQSLLANLAPFFINGGFGNN
jgi:hypothetical protein